MMKLRPFLFGTFLLAAFPAVGADMLLGVQGASTPACPNTTFSHNPTSTTDYTFIVDLGCNALDVYMAGGGGAGGTQTSGAVGGGAGSSGSTIWATGNTNAWQVTAGTTYHIQVAGVGVVGVATGNTCITSTSNCGGTIYWRAFSGKPASGGTGGAAPSVATCPGSGVTCSNAQGKIGRSASTGAGGSGGSGAGGPLGASQESGAPTSTGGSGGSGSDGASAATNSGNSNGSAGTASLYPSSTGGAANGGTGTLGGGGGGGNGGASPVTGGAGSMDFEFDLASLGVGGGGGGGGGGSTTVAGHDGGAGGSGGGAGGGGGACASGGCAGYGNGGQGGQGVVYIKECVLGASC